MTSLEQELRALAAAVDWPATPDIRPAVAAQIVEPPARPRVRPWLSRRLAVALTVVVAALAVTLAVPPARAAILDWLGIGSARIVHVDQLPPLDLGVPLEVLGEPMTLDEARARAGFPFSAPPDEEPAPDEVRVLSGQRVSYVWLDDGRVRALITQVPAGLGEEAVIQKLIPPGTTIEQLEIDGDRAVWLEGGPHAVFLVAPDGTYREDGGWLAGATLLVDRGGVTIRVEGALERDDAVQIVRSMHP